VAVLLIVDHVLVRVTIGRDARQGSKEVVKGADVNSGVKCWEMLNSG